MSRTSDPPLNRRALLSAATLAASVGALVSLSGAMAPARAAEPIRIGFFAPLTGNVAAYGVRFREAVELKVDEVNAKGGIDGRPIELVVEDDRNQPKDAATIAQKLVNTPGLVLAIGGFSTTASLAAAPIFGEAKIPQVSPSVSHPDFTRQSDYQFRQNNREDNLALTNAEIILDKLKAKTVVIPYNQDDWGQFSSKTTAEAVEKGGGKVLLLEPVAPNSKDFRPLVSKIKSLNPDAVFVALYAQEAAILTQHLRQAGVNIPIGGPTPLTNPKFIELAGKDADGVVLHTIFFVGDPAKQDFVKAYEARYKRPPDQWAALAYDTAGVSIDAIRRVAASGKPITGEAVRDALDNGPAYEGVTGVTKYNRGDVTKKPTIITIRDGAYSAL
ncbi:ABC transporter substrate-binding protein [Xanthobacter sp. V4C-4]|uniref:ABC transporter substrate-binding protein n=1 Tax=Xanthobacter cornucopiae TaxID=3119924 RepID=UPI00372ACDB1